MAKNYQKYAFLFSKLINYKYYIESKNINSLFKFYFKFEFVYCY